MAKLKINVFNRGESEPKTTVTIPTSVLSIASKLMPKQAIVALQGQGIELSELIQLAKNPGTRGVLVEVEDHQKDKKVVISLE